MFKTITLALASAAFLVTPAIAGEKFESLTAMDQSICEAAAETLGFVPGMDVILYQNLDDHPVNVEVATAQRLAALSEEVGNVVPSLCDDGTQVYIDYLFPTRDEVEGNVEVASTEVLED